MESETDEERDVKIKNLINLSLLPIAVAAGALNLVVIGLSVKFFRQLGGAPYAIICSMTIADSLQTSVASPFLVYYKSLGLYAENYVHCVAVSALMWLSKPASALALTLLSIDKLLYIYRPYQYPVLMGRRRTVAYCALCWAVCVATCVFTHATNLYELRTQETAFNSTRANTMNYCDGYRQYVDIYWLLGDTLVFAVLPVGLAIAVSVLLYTATDYSRASAYTTLINTVWIGITLLPLRIYYVCCWGMGFHDPWAEFSLVSLESLYAIVNPILTFTLGEVYLRRVRGSSTVVQRFNMEVFFFY